MWPPIDGIILLVFATLCIKLFLTNKKQPRKRKTLQQLNGIKVLAAEDLEDNRTIL